MAVNTEAPGTPHIKYHSKRGAINDLTADGRTVPAETNNNPYRTMLVR